MSVTGVEVSGHTPVIRLIAARRAYEAAQAACVHWDFESDGSDHECCREMEDAARGLSLARKAVRT